MSSAVNGSATPRMHRPVSGNRHDVVVIGAGLAGLTAAVRLAEAGASVIVLAKGVGATHLGPATIDVLGYHQGERVERPLETLPAFCAANPAHPYAITGTEHVAAAIGWLGEQLAEAGSAPYAYVGGPEENLLLPTAVGAAKPTAAAPESMAAGDLRQPGPLRIVGFRALRDFHPALAADNLGVQRSDPALSVELDFAADTRPDANALGLARRFDDPAFRRAVAAQLVGRLGVAERVGFPAVLGITDPHAAWTDMQHLLGRSVFEIPTLPPSVSGMRVFNALTEALRRHRGRVIFNATVGGPVLEGGRLTGVRAGIGMREAIHHADQFVLASGGVASGGIGLDSRWQASETALGLPLAHLPGPDEPRFSTGYFDHHAFSRVGVATDAQLRPLDAGGAVVHDNLRVAGATLGGAEPWTEGCGDGLSLSSGHLAATSILSATKAATA